MNSLYDKPVLRSYSAEEMLEEIGPCQSLYSTTLYTTSGNSGTADGYICSDGTVDTGGAGESITIGDDNVPEYYRGFVGFNISSLQGWTIVSATLRVYQVDYMNTPYVLLGTIVADHVDFDGSLKATDLDSVALTANIGTISTNVTLEWKTLDVKNYVQADLNAGRTTSQFRLRFTTNTAGGFTTDQAYFEDVEGDGGTGNKPELVVTYE